MHIPPNFHKKIFVYFLCSLFIIGALLTYYSRSPIFADSQASLTIAPRQSDFQFSFSPLDTTSQFSQGSTITYQITYGAKQSAGLSSTITLVANYNSDTINGIHVTDFVPGSASNAYNNTAPVVDLVNRTITWTFSLPQGVTDQTVSFSLKTNSNYTGSAVIPFTVIANMSNQYVSLTELSVTKSFVYAPATSTPTPTTNTTPTPTPSPSIAEQFLFSSIDFRSISPTSISLLVNLTQQGIVTTRFGINPTLLTGTLTTPLAATNHTIVIENLLENTTYYVQLTAQTINGLQEAKSDVYIFHTGQFSEIPQVDLHSLSYIARDIVLYVGKEPILLTPGKSTTTTEQPVVILPTSIIYTLRFKISKTENIKKIEAILRNKNVLGITNNINDEPDTETSDLLLNTDGYYQGRLKSPVAPGIYEEFIRVYDTSGNITEQKIADLHISPPFRVENSSTKLPIENARVLFYYRDNTNNNFHILPSQIYPVQNPLFTPPDGNIQIPLPAGTYKAHVSAIGYAAKDVTFTLGIRPDESYPLILLTPTPFSFITATQYYVTIAFDTLADTKQYISGLSHSIRFFNLNALIVTALLVVMTFLAFVSRLRIPLFHLPSYFQHLLQKGKHENTVSGKLIDAVSKQAVIGANLYLLNMKTHKTLAHVQTNAQGGFMFEHAPESNFAIEVFADGFEKQLFTYDALRLNEHGGLTLLLTKTSVSSTLIQTGMLILTRTLSFFFETLLITSLIFEISLGYTLGWEKAAIFLVFSIANMAFWIFSSLKER